MMTIEEAVKLVDTPEHALGILERAVCLLRGTAHEHDLLRASILILQLQIDARKGKAKEN